RARQLGQLCPQYVKDVVLLKAGHCPHDEVPHQVNQEMIKFMRERILPAEEDMVDASTASSHPGVQAPVGV
ncbi:photolyase/cryptochrome alpha/beta domain-containing protein, partial [Haematococcus lacustris]